MHSFISSFKPLLIAAAVIAVVEGGVLLFGNANALFNSNFLELAFMRAENPNKIQQEIKIHYLPDLNPKIIQVGDSSGASGPQTDMLQSHIPDHTYVHMSCCGDMGYAGHRAIAAASLNRVSDARLLVFYVSPFSTSMNFGNMGPELTNSYNAAYVSPWRHLDPPSMAYRLPVTNLFYYGHFSADFADNPLKMTASELNARTHRFYQFRGWNNRTAGAGIDPPEGNCSFNAIYSNWFTVVKREGRRPVDAMYPELAMTAALARRRGVRLVLVFSPVSCTHGEDANILQIEHEIARFRADYPEVIVPFEFIHTLPKEHFFDPWHLRSSGREEMANKLGPLLARTLADPEYRGVPPTPVAAIAKKLQAVH